MCLALFIIFCCRLKVPINCEVTALERCTQRCILFRVMHNKKGKKYLSLTQHMEYIRAVHAKRKKKSERIEMEYKNSNYSLKLLVAEKHLHSDS